MNAWDRAAAALASKAVTVRHRRPVLAGAIGTAAQDHLGNYFIDIAPWLTDREKLSVLCHEAAHILAGDCPPTSWAHEQSGAVKSPQVVEWQAANCKPRENKADAQAEEWLGHAERYAPRFPGTWLDARLAALAAWPKLRFETMVDEAVKKAYRERGLL